MAFRFLGDTEAVLDVRAGGGTEREKPGVAKLVGSGHEVARSHERVLWVDGRLSRSGVATLDLGVLRGGCRGLHVRVRISQLPSKH